MRPFIFILLAVTCSLAVARAGPPAATRAGAAAPVTFDPAGNFLVEGKPFFPIGVWVYGINPEVLANLQAHHFNTIAGKGFNPPDVPTLEKHGLMMIPLPSEPFIAAARDSKFLLGWYLED